MGLRLPRECRATRALRPSEGLSQRRSHSARRLRRCHQIRSARRRRQGETAIDAALTDQRKDPDRARTRSRLRSFRVSKRTLQIGGGTACRRLRHRSAPEKSSFEATDINAVLINSLGIDPNSDTSGKRTSYAAFAELAIPVVKDPGYRHRSALRPLQRLRQHLQPRTWACAISLSRRSCCAVPTTFRVPGAHAVRNQTSRGP